VGRQEQEHPISADAPALAESLHDRLSRLSRQLRSIELPPGMTQERMSVLAIVERRGPVSVSALAAHERVRPATMSRMISSLEADGYVRRLTDDSDGRGVLVAATQLGLKAFSNARKQRLSQLSEALNALPAEQLNAMSGLASALESLTNVLDDPASN
jgi:DNA-binding MarR family transcriptional regulator